ncbi:D-alanyl-D-alanine carboxypeptidase/D-alanyl-D-alanine-endopeptidase precursor [Candidatus Glomeribacter gigasporarum BEG34]|uniref:D-alanyl-D-alanine carboxypeptidase/D-alanyl-D-alanine-endopeptidase n=1 Tax=Candidatus Glomeribacter gigasporarum BEG34 TaxID=1070319 RepID=G2J7X6_9BURK|nr:D-alanyl-D-alanine carboxypeptidase/D-alanyl-D-alanine-endopeptidase [Candidatus Glomeribacter gigasporarum]CCD28871.1 D-alanyl-D-alanine carboxypeptidase/D-alanyl-D-alanine-endopeptidase precursor [Candidatus Glomeribacter gigasporarum BEG34]
MKYVRMPSTARREITGTQQDRKQVLSVPTFLRVITTAAAAGILLLQGCGLFPAEPAPSVASLAARIQRHIEQPRFSAAQWGIKIVSMDTGRTVFERNADKYCIPASNAKLYTGALALDAFAPGMRIPTRLYATAPIDSKGVTNGHLVLYGQGDPTFGAATETGAAQSPFDALAAQLAQTGLKRVRGHLVINDRYFGTPPIGAGWQADDLQWSYGAQASALTVNENTWTLTVKPAAQAGQPCDIIQETPWIKKGEEGEEDAAPQPVNIVNRTFTAAAGDARGIGLYRAPGSDTLYVFGSLALNDAPRQSALALPHPSEAIGRALQAALEKYRISIDGGLRIAHWLDPEPQDIPERWIPLARLESPPLADLLKQMFKRSQNLYAQDLFLQVGRQTAGTAPASACAPAGLSCTTEQWGVYALNHFLPRAGIQPDWARIQEGSGLARANLVTPAATVALLQYMNRHSAARIFKEALPVAGVDGTLKNRMKNTAAQNNARAKTGTLQYVYALSGYVTTAAKERLAFSIMLNHYAPPKPGSKVPPAPPPIEDIDAIVVRLAEFSGHS